MPKAWTTTLMERIFLSFEAHARPERAVPMKTCMKGQFPILQISAAERRALREYSKTDGAAVRGFVHAHRG
ncbi:MAG: hypothetical protein WCF10_07250 [Polyangiales bacterium]